MSAHDIIERLKNNAVECVSEEECIVEILRLRVSVAMHQTENDHLRERAERAEAALRPVEDAGYAALVKELRADAEQEHRIALMIDPHAMDEQGNPTPLPTEPVEHRLPSRAADTIERLSSRGAVDVPHPCFKEGVEAAAKVADANAEYARKMQTPGLGTSSWHASENTAKAIATRIRALLPPVKP